MIAIIPKIQAAWMLELQQQGMFLYGIKLCQIKFKNYMTKA